MPTSVLWMVPVAVTLTAPSTPSPPLLTLMPRLLAPVAVTAWVRIVMELAPWAKTACAPRPSVVRVPLAVTFMMPPAPAVLDWTRIA